MCHELQYTIFVLLLCQLCKIFVSFHHTRSPISSSLELILFKIKIGETKSDSCHKVGVRHICRFRKYCHVREAWGRLFVFGDCGRSLRLRLLCLLLVANTTCVKGALRLRRYILFSYCYCVKRYFYRIQKLNRAVYFSPAFHFFWRFQLSFNQLLEGRVLSDKG